MICSVQAVLIAGLFGALLLAGCGAGPALSPSPPPEPTTAETSAAGTLDGSRWELVSIKGAPPLPDTTITLNFEHGTAGGVAGCNHYGAPYRLDGNRLKLEGMFTLTAMLCNTPDGVMEQEQEYIDTLTQAAFHSTATFRLVPGDASGRLEIGDALGIPLLVYQNRLRLPMDPAALPGTNWRLAALEGEPLHAAGVTLSFINDREVIGFAGCRRLYAAYQARGDRITFPVLGMIGPDCHENERLNLQESTVSDAFSRASAYRLEGGRLDLQTEQGGVISFIAMEAEPVGLEDAVWSLAAVFGPSVDPQMVRSLPVEPLPGSTVTLEFDGQRASGSAGCNTYFAPYTARGDSLAVEPAVTTDMHCAQPEGLMRQEAEFLRLLPEMRRYRLPAGMLWLESDGGYALLFTREGTGR